jgi:diamine N-acetyltransferase
VKTKLVEVDEENWRECVKLEVADEEKYFVDRNVFAIAEWKFEPENKIKAIYSDSVLVGMLAYYYHDGSYGEFYWLYHLMIETKHQRKGYGQDAVRLAIKEMRDLGAKDIVTSYHRENMRVKHIYEKLGFKDNGLEGGDPFLILPAESA